MSLKERLFGPPWESKDAATRRRAVASSQDPKLKPALPAIARDDGDAGVRLAALKRLDDEAAWIEASRGDDDAGVRKAADHAVVQDVVRREAPADRLAARLDWLSGTEDNATLRRIATDARDTDLRRAALDRIAAQGFLGDCVISETDDALAADLLARIDQLSTLKRIAKSLRTRHKGRHQAALRRMAELEHGHDRHAATDELAAHLIDAVQKLARGDTGGDRKAEADRLESEWKALNQEDSDLERRFTRALEIVRKSLEPRPEKAAAEPAPTRAPDADAELEQLADQAQKLASSPAGEETAAALNDLMSRFDRRWNDLRKPGDADRHLRTRFNALVGELQARVQAHQGKVDSTRHDAAAADDARREERTRTAESLSRALDSADEALASGDVRESHAAIREARRQFDALPGGRPPRDASSRLSRMNARLKEMRDWQHWSNNKLRERLIERVEEIDPAELHPDAVTARLKELRERWKELDDLEVLPGDKRRFAAPQGQWRRFQRACKTAFEAAKPYLEKRSEVRDQSLAELDEFLASARTVVDDQNTETDLLVRYQRAAREAIRNLDTLPPKSRSKSASALRGLMDDISAALDTRFDAIEAEKRKLVAEARKLAHESDRDAAIERAKSLQAAWKQAGRGRRKVEDKLWREFREPIDPLFENLKQERDQRRKAEHEHAQTLKSLCERAEALAAAEDPESAAGPLSGLEEEFGQFEKVPGALVKRFEKAMADHRKRVARQKAEREERKSAHVRQLATALQDAWARVLADGSAPLAADLPEVPDDDALGQSLAQRLRELCGDTPPVEETRSTTPASTDAARQVVVEMECLSGLETPEADRQRRMDHQINRLSTRLGEGAPRPDLDSERAELHRRWWQSFPHEPEQHDELARRFEAADRILQQMTAQ